MVTKDDTDYDARIQSIDFAGISGANKAGRASVAVGRSNQNRMSVQMKFGTQKL